AMSDPTGTGASVFGTSPTFTTQITTPIVYFSSASGGTGIIDSTSNATKGALTFGTASSSNIYNFNIGTSSALISLQGRVGLTTAASIYMNPASGSPTSTNYVINQVGVTD